MGNSANLIERERSCLVVIDVQQYFLDKLPPDWRAPLVERIAWLMRVARLLDIPVIATAEDVEREGHSCRSSLAACRPAHRRSSTRWCSGCGARRTSAPRWKHPDGTASCWSGSKTDVCVAQSALGLCAAGYRVAVVGDACASPPPNHEHGLLRLRDTGVILTSVKTMFYEWTRDLETTHRVRAELQVPYPTGITF